MQIQVDLKLEMRPTTLQVGLVIISMSFLLVWLCFSFSCIGEKGQLYFGSLDRHGYVCLVGKLKAQMRMWFWLPDQCGMLIYF